MKPNVIIKEEPPLLLALALWVLTAPFVFLIAVQITGAALRVAVAALMATCLAICFVMHHVLTRQSQGEVRDEKALSTSFLA